jgi:hypothetical protein
MRYFHECDNDFIWKTLWGKAEKEKQKGILEMRSPFCFLDEVALCD